MLGMNMATALAFTSRSRCWPRCCAAAWAGVGSPRRPVAGLSRRPCPGPDRTGDRPPPGPAHAAPAPPAVPAAPTRRPAANQEPAQQRRRCRPGARPRPRRGRPASPSRIGGHDGGVLDGGVVDVALQHRDGVEQAVEPHPGIGAGRPAAGSTRSARRSSDGTGCPAGGSPAGWPPFTSASRASSASAPLPAAEPAGQRGRRLTGPGSRRRRSPPPAGRSARRPACRRPRGRGGGPRRGPAQAGCR